MNFSEAIDALKKGSKVRIKGWPQNSYIKKVTQDNSDDVRYYQQILSHFVIDPKMLLTENWYVKGYEKFKYSFPKMLDLLLLGKECKLQEWDEDSSIIYDKDTRLIIKKDNEEGPSFIDLQQILFSDWEIVGESS